MNRDRIFKFAGFVGHGKTAVEARVNCFQNLEEGVSRLAAGPIFGSLRGVIIVLQPTHTGWTYGWLTDEKTLQFRQKDSSCFLFGPKGEAWCAAVRATAGQIWSFDVDDQSLAKDAAKLAAVVASAPEAEATESNLLSLWSSYRRHDAAMKKGMSETEAHNALMEDSFSVGI